MEPLPPPPKTPLYFNDKFEEYVSLVDPSSMPTTDFLPTTDSLSLHDRLGTNRSIPTKNGGILYEVDDEDVLLESADPDLHDGADSEGAADATLEEGATMKRRKSKPPPPPLIVLDSDSFDDDCTIICSVPGSTVARSRGPFHPPLHSVTDIVVKKEPIDIGAPNSPTLWGDFDSPEDAYAAHETYVQK